jgi:hypothetical protein
MLKEPPDRFLVIGEDKGSAVQNLQRPPGEIARNACRARHCRRGADYVEGTHDQGLGSGSSLFLRYRSGRTDLLDFLDQATALGRILNPVQSSPEIVQFALSLPLSPQVALWLSGHVLYLSCLPKRARHGAEHKVTIVVTDFTTV